MLSTNPWMSTRDFPCHYTIVRKEAERRTAHREKDSPGQLFTVFVRAVSLLLLAGTFHEHLLLISIHQQPLFPAMDFCPASTCIRLHVLHILAYRISRVRVTLLSIHEAQLPSRRRFAGAKAPVRKRPYSNRGSSLPPGPASLAVAESPPRHLDPLITRLTGRIDENLVEALLLMP